MFGPTSVSPNPHPLAGTVPLPHRGSSRAPGADRTEMALYGIYEISKLLAMPARMEINLAGVLSLLSSFLDMRNGLIALLDGTGAPEIVVGSGWSEATAKRYFRRLPERAIGRIVVTQTPLVVENVAHDPLFAGVDFSTWGPKGVSYSFIGVPIKVEDRVIGTLTIDRNWNEQPHFHYDRDVRFLTMVANLVGQSVRLQRLIAQDRQRLIAEQHRLAKAMADSVRSQRGLTAQSGERHGVVGDSPAIRAVLDKVRIVARSHTTVLLRGESGTGKELFAQALHEMSPRNKAAFVKLNCAALPESVLESELFGHEKGAFTGAHALRKGRFEMADGGTLFLDEIGEISAMFQAKLLRVIQEGEFERVGGSKTIKTDVRLIAATNRNLEEAVAKGDFRADLYYRISVVPLFLPPLRDRPSDIPKLAREFLRRFNEENGTHLTLTENAVQVLSGCYFPGNVRELENCVRRTATLAHGPSLTGPDFACRNDGCLSAMLWKGPARDAVPAGFQPLPIAPRNGAPAAALPPAPATSADEPPEAGGEWPAGCPAPGHCPATGDGKSEKERLVEAMETAGWVQAKAARLLGLTPRQMGYALRKHDIPIKKF
ncbi:nif-specific transcriptional activator NifA [Zavarzinia compransoris]|uniref:nif-specific transcriptional activator NifA n=1 Tax=Zavarzinia marina TaxID=2911065 RepID=UPI001F228B38|nr:nif-specific transcriptional activator NifA [Zavarzinia marina]MCF4164797.1 nif-specific transcriptional activator NifA [Zavarzinia marina]